MGVFKTFVFLGIGGWGFGVEGVYAIHELL